MNGLVLSTNRLILKELEPLDLENIHTLHSLPETDEFNTLGIPENIHVTEALLNDWLEAQAWEPRNSYRFKIESGEHFVGLMGMNLGKLSYRRGEVWYKLHKDFWNQGYATEALNRLLEFAFKELNLHRVEAGCAVENAASVKVLEKVGMVREGRTRKLLPIRGEWKDSFLYAILEEDFFES